jgi:hypothetical protein
MPTATPETLAALATIGLEAAHGQSRRTIRAGIDQRLVEHPGEVFRSDDPGLAEAFPRGLTIMEALGFTVALGWADRAPSAGGDILRVDHWRVACPESRWAVRLPVANAPTRTMEGSDALRLTLALLHIRRIICPTIPWRRRDPVADELERRARQIEASLRPPQRPEVITPYTAASDVGRAWS